MHIQHNRIFLLSCSALVLFLALGVLTVPTHAQTDAVLYSFCAKKGCADGKQPQNVTLASDAKGNLYGTTLYGGADQVGTVFRLTTSGVEQVYSFQNNGTDGTSPLFGVVLDKAGNLYGTTPGGGAYGYGTVYKVTSSGVETILHSFNLDGADGTGPEGALIIDASGNLYGTTGDGGSNCLPGGCGTVFEITALGAVTILYSFADNGVDGFLPAAGLAMDTNGNLYGTTPFGGAYNRGTVYEVTPSSGVETILYSFGGNANDGETPTYAPLVVDVEGNVYGTTPTGGAHGLGTAFKVTPLGVETTLHSFGANDKDGQFPYGGLILDAAGNVYGTADTGGPHGEGAIFKLTPSGTETILYSFPANSTDGETPLGGLLAAKGSIYGTTQYGGTSGYGTVFKVTR
jgi:uncharacterized repeat protein (TIGR03803 family)